MSTFKRDRATTLPPPLSTQGETLTDEAGRQFRMTTKRLGRGTFAEVFLGVWLNPQPPGTKKQLVAIKQFFLSKQTLDRALETEINIMRDMDHPNIVKLISVIFSRAKDDGPEKEELPPEEDRLWVILEFCAGGDFRSFIKGKRLSEKWACKFLLQIVEGLKYLRERDIIHRDLKPHNLLLSKNRKLIKIADFGFARIVGSEALAATMCGSPLYMAPEVLRGDEYNSKADLWSVGIILYEMLCGERPFKDVKSIVALQQTVEKAPIMFPRRVRISRSCRNLLQALLVKDPMRRIQWEDFFNHPWLKTNWENLTQSLENSAPSIDEPWRHNIPKSSAPISIEQSGVKRGLVRNYMQLSSAPGSSNLRSPPPIRSSVSFSTTPTSAGPGSSVFVPSSTPHGGSDPFGGAKTQSITPTSRSQSLKQTLSDVFSTGYGLLKDSLQNGY